MKRKDERDIMFSRMGNEEGSKEYNDYYMRNPEKKEYDDELRAMKNLSDPDSPTYDKNIAPAVDANFMFLGDIRQFSEGEVASSKMDYDKDEMSALIKKLGLHYGAIDVGITIARDEFYYSHRGRRKEHYGQEVDTSLKTAIVFLVQMDKDMVNSSPMMTEMLETSKAYVDAAIIGMQLSYYIRNLGYNARNHMDGNYLMCATPLAQEAGLGQRGRNGLLNSKKNGCFVRIGMVTTDMDLNIDDRVDYELAKFCKLCVLCARTCPAKTITKSNTVADWKIQQEECYRIWRSLGTDCGVCISSCPIGQDIDLQDIKNMNEDEITSFINDYMSKNGYRKRAINPL